MTLARRHFQRVTAAAASATAEAGEPINASAYELQLAKLAEDKRRLKEIQSIERKVAVKRQLLPDYEPWVDGVLEAGRGAQDAVLMTVMVWHIDVGDYGRALRIAAYALENGLVLPDQYQRDVATLVAEEIADQALSALSAGGEFSAVVLGDTEFMTRGKDMPDEVRAKLHKALGLVLANHANAESVPAAIVYAAGTALEHLRRALSLHERVGVKKDIERLERLIKNTPVPTAYADGTSHTNEAKSSAAETGASDDARTGQSGAPAPVAQG